VLNVVGTDNMKKNDEKRECKFIKHAQLHHRTIKYLPPRHVHKMVVLPHHPFWWLSIINNPFWGTPILGNLHITIHQAVLFNISGIRCSFQTSAPGSLQRPGSQECHWDALPKAGTWNKWKSHTHVNMSMLYIYGINNIDIRMILDVYSHS
jgi:hypothetical protein